MIILRKLIKDNWNRIDLLINIHDKTNQEVAELKFRKGIQNDLNTLTDEMIVNALEWINKEVKKDD